MITLRTNPSTNEKNGSGKYRGLRRRKKTVKGSSKSFRYLANSDLTMQFADSRDPIYYAFDYLNKRTVPQLIGDFVEDYFSGAINFVSKVIKQ